MMKCVAILGLFCLLFAPLSLSATTTFYAQSATGAANGTSCANALAIGGGVTVAAGNTATGCGKFTTAFTITFKGSAGNLATFNFSCPSSPQYSVAAIPSGGAITFSGTYGVFDGAGCFIIQSTDNGSALAGFGHQQISQAVAVSNSDHLRFTNFTCANLYVHTAQSDTTGSGDNAQPRCITGNDPSNSNMEIDHTVMHDCSWCIMLQGSGHSVHDNTIYNFDHGLAIGNLSDSPRTFSNIYFYNNHLYHATTWDTGTSGAYHHDGIHFFAYCANGGSYCPNTIIGPAYIYNNRFDGDWGAINVTAQIFFEENVRNSYVFNNVFDCSVSQCDSGALYGQGVNNTVVNNTFIGSGSQSTCMGGTNIGLNQSLDANCPGSFALSSDSSGLSGKCQLGANSGSSCTSTNNDCNTHPDAGPGRCTTPQRTANLSVGGPGTVARNNIIANSNSLINVGSTNEGGDATTVTALTNNIYYEPCTYAGGSNGQCGSGGAAFGWKGNINDGSSFNAWKTISGETSSSLVVNTSKGVLINSDGSLPDTSAAIKAGVNLFSTCNGQPNPGLGALCSDANGNPRPTSGSWDAGAYSSASSSASGGQPPSGGQPSPPTGLIGVVR